MVDAQDNEFIAVAEIDAIDDHIWSTRHDPLKRAVNDAKMPEPREGAQASDHVHNLIKHTLRDDHALLR